jgi:protein involved in polysaccharide export with SLBB domain
MFKKYLKICGLLFGTIYLFFPVVASAQSTGETSLINSYHLAPADVIDIQVFDEPDLSGKFKLNEDGVIHFAFVGDFVCQCRH